MAGHISPIRRVLADKNRNASLHINNKHAKTASTVQVNLPRASTSFNDTPKRPTHGVESLSPKLGQKRKIDQVEEAEIEDSANSSGTEALSDLSDPVSELNTDAGDITIDSSSDTRPTTQTTLPSFHASQADVGPMDVQFEIHEEMSQTTLDKLVS